MNQFNNKNAGWGAPAQQYTQQANTWGQPVQQAPAQQYTQQATAYTDEDAPIDWNAPITKDEAEFVLLPEGVYPFTIQSFERTQSSKTQKPMMKINLKITSGPVEKIMAYYLVYTKKGLWRIGQFFVAIGMKQKGVDFIPDWNQVPGRQGRIEIKIEKSQNGNDINTLGNLITE